MFDVIFPLSVKDRDKPLDRASIAVVGVFIVDITPLSVTGIDVKIFICRYSKTNYEQEHCFSMLRLRQERLSTSQSSPVDCS